MATGGLPRGGHVLRPVGLPHHVAADLGVAATAHHRARAVLGPAGPAPAARPAALAGLRRALRRLRGSGGHVPGTAARFPLDALLRGQLALHPERRQLLRPGQPAVPAHPHLVPGRRRAVLSGVAARGPRCAHTHGPAVGDPGRVGGGRPGLGRRNGAALSPRSRVDPAVLRDRHARPVHAGRRGPGVGAGALRPPPPCGRGPDRGAASSRGGSGVGGVEPLGPYPPVHSRGSRGGGRRSPLVAGLLQRLISLGGRVHGGRAVHGGRSALRGLRPTVMAGR